MVAVYLIATSIVCEKNISACRSLSIEIHPTHAQPIEKPDYGERTQSPNGVMNKRKEKEKLPLMSTLNTERHRKTDTLHHIPTANMTLLFRLSFSFFFVD